MSCPHSWYMKGGRQCPRNPDARASQAVYECGLCGEIDYGDPDGPGYRDCIVNGPCHRSCWISKKERKKARKEMVRAEIERRRRAMYMAFYAMNDDPKWKCKDGREMRFSEMETSHVRNTIKMILRGHDVSGAKVSKKANAKLARLKLELGFRESMNERFNMGPYQGDATSAAVRQAARRARGADRSRGPHHDPGG